MMERILQANLNNEGGAFSLIYQVQKNLNNEFVFDYYTMGKFNIDNSYKYLKYLGSSLFECNLRKNRFIGHIFLPFYFYNFLKKNSYHTVHIHSDTAWKMFLYAFPAKRNKTKSIILHSHSSGINGDYRGIKRAFHKLFCKIVLRYGDIFCACSSEAAMWMFGEKVDVKILKNGVDVKRFGYSLIKRESMRNELNVTDEEILIGTVGDFSDAKNPNLLIDIYKDLSIKSKKYKLIFIGDGYNKGNVIQYAKQKKIDKYIIFYGKTDKMDYLYNALDIFILPSKFEGLPVSAIEAQANGMNVILSSNITKEVKISPFCQYVEYSEDTTYWIKAINNCNFKINRNDGINMIHTNGFDIKDTAKHLNIIYSKMFSEESKREY